DALGCESHLAESVITDRRYAGLNLEAPGVDMVLIRRQHTVQAVGDPLVQQEETELRLIDLQELADLPKALAATGSGVAVHKFDLWRRCRKRGLLLLDALGLFGSKA